jgi:hypothetical protein
MSVLWRTGMSACHLICDIQAAVANDCFGSTPVIRNSEPNFRKGPKAVIGHGR